MAELTMRGGEGALGSSGMSLKWSVGEGLAKGQDLSGDRFLIKESGAGTLILVLDALGHGTDASQVADLAMKEIEIHASPALEDAVRACHAKLSGTRGAVASLAWFDHLGSLSWLGIGNVLAVLWRPSYGRLKVQAVVRSYAGIIGMKLPAFSVETKPLQSNDLLVMATDGIGNVFAGDFGAAMTPEAIVRILVEEHKLASDDGLVVVASYVAQRHG